MCNALPGQVDCKRAGCSLPINVEPNGRRHPFCSIECARACGENPCVPPQAIPAQATSVVPPRTDKSSKKNRSIATSPYPSPLASDSD
ncbi:hypothetical protein BGZ96_009390 [Linnemannia gamsii]|uniref:Uncharacterized protein n=1 Tax=Linnemannia gamsii TaxID=64522 RepID=A0ABQ7JX75_9FUNG|nr:hypothetical protein BGZ96_009390 [Linnemannia gamsii]